MGGALSKRRGRRGKSASSSSTRAASASAAAAVVTSSSFSAAHSTDSTPTLAATSASQPSDATLTSKGATPEPNTNTARASATPLKPQDGTARVSVPDVKAACDAPATDSPPPPDGIDMTLQTSAPAGAGAGTIGEDLNAVTPQVSADSPGANARATGETSSLVPDPALLAACRGRRLVVLIGAGCSLMPPTSLPSWNKINEAVLDALVARSTQSENSTDNVVVSPELASSARDAVSRQLAQYDLPPEYFSEILVNRLGAYYFNVLTVLDSATPNTVHETIALLAQAGCVAAIVTTNFDLCTETALANAGVNHEVWKSHTEFDAVKMQNVIDGNEKTCFVLKVHGSADAAATVVDTLSQRAMGLPGPVVDVLHMLLEFGHWLVLGYSGADLAAAPGYLGLRPCKDSAAGFTWLIRQGIAPLPVVEQLTADYNGRGRIDFGELPDYLTPLRLIGEEFLKEQDMTFTPNCAVAPVVQSLEQRVTEWANHLLPGEAAVALADVLKASQQPTLAVELLDAHLAVTPSPHIDEKGLDGPTLRQLLRRALLLTAQAGLRSKLGDQDMARSLMEDAIALLGHVDPTVTNETTAPTQSSATVLDNISSDVAVHVRAIELQAFAKRDLAEVIRTSAKEGGAFETAANLFREAEAAFAALPDNARFVRGRAICAMGQGDVLRVQMDPTQSADVDRCLAFYENVTALAKSIGDLPLQSLALKNQGIVLKARAAHSGDQAALEAAYGKYRSSLEVSSRIGDGVEQVKALRGLAGLYQEDGRLEDALDAVNESLVLAKKVGYRAGEARALRVLSDVLGAKNETQAALARLQECLAITQELGDLSGVARGKFSMAKLAAAEGDVKQARQEAEAAIALFLQLNEARHTKKIEEFVSKLAAA